MVIVVERDGKPDIRITCDNFSLTDGRLHCQRIMSEKEIDEEDGSRWATVARFDGVSAAYSQDTKA